MVGKVTYARIGLMGNPSDGFFGKTISSCITNFQAKVTLVENDSLNIVPHGIFDPMRFTNLKTLQLSAERDGYYGGIRLIYATCKRFSEYCRKGDIVSEEILDGRKFAVSYDTDIPRQVGLGGSSAIIVSLWKALMQFYGLTNADISLEKQSGLVLSVETEGLGITAGLQDRVIQTHGGTVFMDFDRLIMDKLGHGTYIRINSGFLPTLFVAYMESSGKDSGKMHNEVRHRFKEGDKEIEDAMVKFAEYAQEAGDLLAKGDLKTEGNLKRFGDLMNANFDLRREIYPDKIIGARNIEMIEIARSREAPAKFPGSGGAVIGIYIGEKQYNDLEEQYKAHGFICQKVKLDNSSFSA